MQGHRHGHGVVAGQAGGAEPGARHADRRLQAVELEVGQAVGADVVPDLADLRLAAISSERVPVSRP